MEISEGEALRLYNENIQLKEKVKYLQKENKELEDKLIKCPVTGLFNYNFFMSFLSSEIGEIVEKDSMQNPGLIIISIDNMGKIMYSYGDKEVERVLKNSVYVMESVKKDNQIIFRLQGALFACYIPDTNKEEAVELAEEIRNSMAISSTFIEKITVSIGVVCLNEVRDEESYMNKSNELIYDLALMRVRQAKNMGMNIVCSTSEVQDDLTEQGKILLVDNDEINTSVLKNFLNNLKYEVLIARDGEEALSIVSKTKIDLIVSEIMIPKIDGFLVREKLLAMSYSKKIPFIIMSHLKNGDSVERAANLGIEHYFKKPLMISEFLGVVKNKVKGASY